MSKGSVVAILLVLLLCGGAAMGQSRSWRGDRDRGGRSERSDGERRSERDGTSAADGFSEEYGLVVDQNIFIRDRGRRPPPPPREVTTRPAIPQRTPEQSLMLTGIVIEEGELRAYFENLPTGTIQRVAIGEPIGRGHVIEIMIDAVAYAGESSVQWVEIGHDLTGTPAATAPVSVTGTTSGEPAASGTGAASTEPTDPALMTAAERMRARARQLRGD